MSWLQTVDMINILGNNSGGKMQLAMCWSGSSHLHLRRKKMQLFVILLPIYGCALWRHWYQNSIRKFTVSYSDTFKRLINIPRYTSSSPAYAMNVTDHINVVFCKSHYSLMSRVTTSPNSIITAIVSSDSYQQSPLMDKWKSMIYVP